MRAGYSIIGVHQGLDEAMGDAGTGLLLCLLFFQPGPVPVIKGRSAYFFFEQDAEGADAFKSYIIAYLRHAQIFTRKPALRLLDPFAGQVLMWRPLIDAGEHAMEMKPRHAGVTGDTIEIDYLLKVLVNI